MDLKHCNICGLPKPLIEYPKASKMKSGLSNNCRVCQNHISRIWYQNNKESSLTKSKKWRKDNLKKARKIQNNWRKKNLKAERAHQAVKRAIETGDLTKEPCFICDSPQAQAHHESYDPEYRLDVIWLCQNHHDERHNELRKLQTLKERT